MKRENASSKKDEVKHKKRPYVKPKVSSEKATERFALGPGSCGANSENNPDECGLL